MNKRDIAKIERELGVALPDHYKEYLVKRASAAVRIDKELAEFECFDYSVPYATAAEIIGTNRHLRERVAAKDGFWVVGAKRRPWPIDGRLLVGENGGGNYCFIYLDGSDIGLWWWDHETLEFTKLNDSFEQLFQSLQADLERERQIAKEEEEEEWDDDE